MDALTHLMTGACLARAGFNRKAAYATVAMTLAAEAPDLDTLWAFAGPAVAFQHHRGWTHTLIGLPLEAAIVVASIALAHRFLLHRRLTKPAPPLHKQAAAPVRWRLLYLFCLVALTSHLLLDWTNNYGIRPFFPFNPRWYAGSIVFIFEPVLFAILLIALVAPSLFGLIGTEVGATRSPFRGRGWAIAALVATVALWTWRLIEQRQAIDLALNNVVGAQILRFTANPYPVNPFRWKVILDTPQSYQLATVDTAGATATIDAADIYYKPPTTIATLIAKRSPLGEVYLDWSSYPIVAEQPGDFQGTPQELTAVTFRDLRFMYDVPFLPGREHPPLSGTVYINADHRVVQTEMDGRRQR